MNSSPKFYMERPDRTGRLGLLLAAAVIAAAVLSLCVGPSLISPVTVFRELGNALFREGYAPRTTAARIVCYARLPRACGGLLAGAALAASGAIIQSVLANPLAAPNIIGVNSGAGFAVALCCALAPGAFAALPAAAFLGALAGVLLVLFIGESAGASRLTLVLAGVAISSLFSAGVDAIVTFVPDTLSGYSDFRVGGFSGVTMAKLLPAGIVILIAFLLALSLAGRMDILALGEETARGLGLAVRPVRMALLASAAALAGAAVSFSGLLGFVGLIVPHVIRRLIGENGLPLIAFSALGGAAFVTLCDLLARTLFAPYELPVGIVLAFIGAPFFLWLLFRQKRGVRHG